MKWSEERIVFVGVFLLIAWGALLSSDILTKKVEYAWVMGSFDFVRTLTTVLAAGIALAAYRRWRRPDDAKRRADVAQTLMRVSRNLQSAAMEARIGSWTMMQSGGPVTLEVKLSEKKDVQEARETKRKELKALKKKYEELCSYRAEAGKLFETSKAPELMDALEERCERILKAYTLVDYFDDRHREMLGDEKFVAFMDKHYAALGVQFATDMSEADRDDDPFRTDFLKTRADLVTELERFIVDPGTGG